MSNSRLGEANVIVVLRFGFFRVDLWVVELRDSETGRGGHDSCRYQVIWRYLGGIQNAQVE